MTAGNYYWGTVNAINVVLKSVQIQDDEVKTLSFADYFSMRDQKLPRPLLWVAILILLICLHTSNRCNSIRVENGKLDPLGKQPNYRGHQYFIKN
ncbi:unnamed protein product [Ranitomeya imitator]|uniref:Uncharacterized protein n=1 Tax=Ranitomeya imitator TaxID=111125 RepID=A0ABN9M708_9NEOB|nr:unnamed protein product [Ranitomeya imitator]